MVEPVHTFPVGNDTYCLYAPETPSELFGPYASFVRMWQTKRAGRRLPAWKDFSFEDLMPWVEKTLLVDLDAEDVVDGVYRLCGGDWVRISNMELTGKRYSEVIPDDMRATMEPYHLALHKEGLIGRRVTTSYVEKRTFVRLDMLDLVLSDNGNSATQYLGLAIVVDSETNTRPY